MLVSLIFAATVAAAPAPATTPAPTTAVAAATDANTVICRREEETGTMLGAVRVCMTKAQWDDRAAADRQVLDRQLNSQIAPKS